MKKVLLVCFLPLYLMASYEFFASTGLGMSNYKVSYIGVDRTNGTIKENYHSGLENNILIGGGVIINDTNKFSLEYSNYFSKTNDLLSSYSFGYDYRIVDLYRYDSLLSYNFIPFVGVSYNYMSYKRDTSKIGSMTTGSVSYSLELKSLMGRIGFDYEFDNSPVFFSALYEYSLMVNADRYFYSVTNNNVDYTIYAQHHALSRLLFSIGYKF